jgi:tetratricopeptide (TPR) repeat protein
VSKDDNRRAKEWFRKAVEMDPEFAMAWGGLSIVYYYDIVAGWTADVAGTIDQMRAAGQRSVAISGQSALGHFGLGFAHIFSRRYDAGIQEMERGISSNPSSAHGYYLYSMALMLAGQSERAVESLGRALRLSPRDFYMAQMLSGAAMANVVRGTNEAAIEFGQNAVARAPEHPLGHRNLAIALANLGRMDEAKTAFDNFMRLLPDYSIEKFRLTMPFKDPGDFERAVAGLRKLGLRES